MRPLKIAKTLTPAQQAKVDEALRWLEQQPVPVGWPAGLYAEYVVPNYRFILSLATQHQNRGMSLAELVKVGHAAAVACISRYGEQPGEFADSWGWWVRQGMLEAVGEKQRKK